MHKYWWEKDLKRNPLSSLKQYFQINYETINSKLKNFPTPLLNNLLAYFHLIWIAYTRFLFQQKFLVTISWFPFNYQTKAIVEIFSGNGFGLPHTEAATRAVLSRKMFLKISQNLYKITSVGVSFLIKLQASGTVAFLWILQNF